MSFFPPDLKGWIELFVAAGPAVSHTAFTIVSMYGAWKMRQHSIQLEWEKKLKATEELKESIKSSVYLTSEKFSDRPEVEGGMSIRDAGLEGEMSNHALMSAWEMMSPESRKTIESLHPDGPKSNLSLAFLERAVDERKDVRARIEMDKKRRKNPSGNMDLFAAREEMDP